MNFVKKVGGRLITLILISYILVSLLFSFLGMQDTDYGHSKGMEKKEAFICGFSIIPLGIFALGLILGGFYLLLETLLWVLDVTDWILKNMP